jgi:3-hydroxyisobutyrate dehydrogenase-like beta-hydroxyacid dehydrogenase
MNKRVGVIGLGIMGGAIARNLKERGWVVIGYDIDPAKNAEMLLPHLLRKLGAETPLFSTTAPVYDEAIAMGFGDNDTAAVCKVLELMSGISR